VSRIGYKLYERANSPFWWVYFSIAGKPFRVSTRVPLARRGDAEKKAAQILVSRFDSRDGAAIPAAVAGLSLKQLSEMWITHLQTERQASRKLIERITTDMGQYVERLWQHPTEVTPAAWRAVSYDPDTREAGRLHHSKGGRLKWGSIAHLGNTLRHFLRFCVKKGAITVVPEIHLPPGKLQKLDRAPRAAMEQATREKLIATLLEMGEEKASRVYTALFETWVRRSTLRAMTPRWIDWRAETITCRLSSTRAVGRSRST
jgi:site-specific recombinase XerC